MNIFQELVVNELIVTALALCALVLAGIALRLTIKAYKETGNE